MQSASDVLQEIETRATALGLDVPEVFTRAGFNPGTWRLWSAGKANPSYRITGAIDALLTKLEAKANGRAKR